MTVEIYKNELQKMQEEIKRLQTENEALSQNISERNMAKRVRILRELLGYSQEYIAMNIDLSQSAYSKVEGGGTEMTQQRLQKILKILDITLKDFLKFDLTQIIKDKKIKI